MVRFFSPYDDIYSKNTSPPLKFFGEPSFLDYLFIYLLNATSQITEWPCYNISNPIGHDFGSHLYFLCPLEYMMTHGSGVIIVVADAAANRVVPLLISSEHTVVFFSIYAEGKITASDRTLEVSS